jgi:hypothetical protein
MSRIDSYIEKFLPVAIFKMATTIPHKFNIVRFQWHSGRWNQTMWNLCGIVVAILKMATGRNFSMSGINSGHHNLSYLVITLINMKVLVNVIVIFPHMYKTYMSYIIIYFSVTTDICIWFMRIKFSLPNWPLTTGLKK